MAGGPKRWPTQYGPLWTITPANSDRFVRFRSSDGPDDDRSRDPTKKEPAGSVWVSGDLFLVPASEVFEINALRPGIGGGRGIRTLDTVSRIHALQACAFDHSATPPRWLSVAIPANCSTGGPSQPPETASLPCPWLRSTSIAPASRPPGIRLNSRPALWQDRWFALFGRHASSGASAARSVEIVFSCLGGEDDFGA